jgi:hypothetical protein
MSFCHLGDSAQNGHIPTNKTDISGICLKNSDIYRYSDMILAHISPYIIIKRTFRTTPN